MNSLSIILKIKPLSINGYYRNSKSGHRVKTGAGLAYDEELALLLRPYEKAMAAFKNSLPEGDVLSVDYTFFASNYFVKDGSRINKASGDVDNPVKVLQDKIFRAMDVDDHRIKSFTVEQIPSSDCDGIVVDIYRDSPMSVVSFTELFATLGKVMAVEEACVD